MTSSTPSLHSHSAASRAHSQHSIESTPTHADSLPDPEDHNDPHTPELDVENVELEKVRTAPDVQASGSELRPRRSRTQSLTRRSTRGRFTHPLTHVKTSEAEIVDFDGPEDPYRPMNWPNRKKIITTLLYGLTTMGATWSSSVFTPAVEQVASIYHVSDEVSLLGMSLLIAGFGIGPMVWGPMSEVYGRKSVVLAPYFVAICFTFGTAAAKDLQTILITRFFAGVFASAPITNTGGVLSDIWSPQERGTALVVYAFAVVGGPTLGPIVGAAITESYLGWRWTEYITGIMMAAFLVIDMIVLDETYPPMLLVYKARRLRHESGNWALHARHEEWDVSWVELANKFLMRPIRLLGTPICFLMALYASFCYGILYLSLAAFPIEFEDVRGWPTVSAQLPFLGLLFGVVLGGGVNILNNKFYIRRFEAHGNRPVPEARLPPMMLGSLLFAAGLFEFAWTSSASIHWIAPVIGTVMIGTGFFTIFQCALNYLIDTFQKYAASAIAANTLLRSLLAAAFPLFVNPMFNNLGVDWAMSVLAFIATALIPIPYLFYIYGPAIRKRGAFTS